MIDSLFLAQLATKATSLLQAGSTKEEILMRIDDTKTCVVPAVLSGRSNRSGGVVVHLVECSEQEKRTGIRYLATSMCGKKHGARSAGWAHLPDYTAATCPKCLELQRKRAEVALTQITGEQP